MNGCVLFLVDESAAMGTDVVRPIGAARDSGPRKSKLESVTTLINSSLNKLAQGQECDIALVGYRTDNDGNADIGSRWGGPLAGRDFVRSSELSGGEITVESRVRRVPGPGGILEEQTIDFPVWYQPEAGNKAPQIAAFGFCSEILSGWTGNGASFLLHLFAGASSDGNPLKAVQNIQELDLEGGAPLVIQAHLSSADNVPATLYPATRAYLNSGSMRDLFSRSSLLPEPLINALRTKKLTVQADARGMLYNARMIDLSQLTSLLQDQLGPEETISLEDEEETISLEDEEETISLEDEEETISLEDEEEDSEPEDVVQEGGTDQVASAFEPAIGSVTAESPALVTFILDRSLTDPFSGDSENSFTKLRDYMNELVGLTTKFGQGGIDVGIVSYGLDDEGELDIRNTLEGKLEGRTVARDDQLIDGAILDDSYVEEVSNGIGGIMQIPHTRPVLVEVDPTNAAPATPAFRQLAQIITGWCDDHPNSSMPPVVLHLTRGQLDSTDMQSATEALSSITTSNSEKVCLYHLVVTEDEHPSVAYPDSESDLADERLKMLWRVTSPLLCRSQIAEDNPDITNDARGFVVNNNFSLLLDAIKRTIDD